MAGDHRVQNRTRHAYRTNSNRIKAVKTPGGKHVAHFITKARKGVACANTGCRTLLPGIKHMSRSAFKTAKGKDKSVSRAYGGNLCGTCVKQRIVRAFLIEEQKIVKKVLAEKSTSKKSKAEK